MGSTDRLPAYPFLLRRKPMLKGPLPYRQTKGATVSAHLATQLRKEGTLDEALAIGKEPLEPSAGNLWNRRAVGWVLLDLMKSRPEIHTKAQRRPGSHRSFSTGLTINCIGFNPGVPQGVYAFQYPVQE